MDVPVWLPWLVGYLALGLLPAACWCMVAWKTNTLKEVLASKGYEYARYRLFEIAGLLIVFWPAMISFSTIRAMFDHLSNVGNPHLAHRKSWERQLALKSIEEQEFPGEDTVALVPECACQIDPHYDKNESNPYLSEYMTDEDKISLLIKQREALKKEILRLRGIGLS